MDVYRFIYMLRREVMKKTLLLLSCMALMSTMATARITGDQCGDINAADEVLRLQVRFNAEPFVGAFWMTGVDGDYAGRDMRLALPGRHFIGCDFPEIPDQYIGIVGPKDGSGNNVKVEFQTSPLVFSNGASGSVGIDVVMSGINGDGTANPLYVDTDSAGPSNGHAVEALAGFWGGDCEEMQECMGGDIVKLAFTTADVKIPLSAGTYIGEATVTVSLHKNYYQ